MNSSVLIIALKEFRDRLRSGWVIACVLAWLGVISMTSLFGLIQIGQIGVQGYERTTMSLLNLVQYLVPLLGLLVGHDLIVREREDRTLHLVLASGVTRGALLMGKFLGGALTVSVPLVLGFVIAGTLIGFAARDAGFGPFLKLAASGLLLGIAFSGIGLLVSTFSRSRVQALVCALLAWGVAVFAFDLIALGVIVSREAVQASHEIDVMCDATHVNSQADIHAAFDGSAPVAKRSESNAKSFGWLWLNPVDVFRVINLPSAFAVPLPMSGAIVSMCLWILLSLVAAGWRLKRVDL
ncbi:MAG TPA: ABC transporter permease subunit [Candidatus Acidoferrum sp.]|nr:ABC transporter permease subunit [Candidatus Acidoferrum sp.]